MGFVGSGVLAAAVGVGGWGGLARGAVMGWFLERL